MGAAHELPASKLGNSGLTGTEEDEAAGLAASEMWGSSTFTSSAEITSTGLSSSLSSRPGQSTSSFVLFSLSFNAFIASCLKIIKWKHKMQAMYGKYGH